MVWRFSKTAANNATADPTINYAEGMAPSAVNDSARAEMARVAQWRDDISGAIVTGGTSTAYTVTSNQVFDTLAHMDGAMIAFTPHVINGATVTLNVDSLGAKPLRLSPSVELQSNVLVANTPYVATYNNSDAVWYLRGLGGNAYGIPLGMGADFWLPTAPSSAFAFPVGQAISRTTYATLFAAMGTTHGSGDGSTTFNLPNKMERVSVMKAGTAALLLPPYFTGDATAIGATGGSPSQLIDRVNLPNVALTATLAVNTISTPTSVVTGGTNSGTTGGVATVGTGAGTIASTGTATGSTQSMNGGFTQTQLGIVQPTIVCNYILRII